MRRVSIRGAAQVLRPPADGLPYLRGDRAGELALEPGDVLLEGGRIAGFERADGRVVDASGCAVLPGFVDCHTHLPFAGWRAQEYERKVTGVPYEEIARAGGGIASSARSLAEASDEDVLAQAQALARELLEHGTTAFEGKTGYGLSREGEARAARLGRELAARVAQPMRLTGLFAHAVPPGTTADAWMDEAEALARECDVDALDIFVETVAFGNEHLARWGAIARDTGRALRAHVEQLSTQRSVPVALEWGARSVDHLSLIHPDDVAPLAASETAAVLLPGAELMNAEHTAPARALADAGADLRARDRPQPGHVAGRVDARDHRPRGPALRMERARGTARGDPQRRLRARVVRGARLARAGQARRRAAARRPGRARPLPLRPQPRRGGLLRRRARLGAPGPGLAGRRVIAAAELRDRLAGLEPIGLGPDGTNRLAWTPELAAAEAWFGEQARSAGLRVERDPAGSLWAVPEAPAPWWATGSHLDSVRSGGRFDGALGMAAGFAIAERLPGVAVIAFADEEGARFNTPTFGSRALVGRLDLAGVLARTDDDGIALADAMRAAGADPDGLADAPSWLERLRGFVELHIDQTRDLERLGEPAGAVRALASRMRLALTFAGRADHAGTTRRAERRDALAAAARLIVAADELAGGDPDFLVTAARMLVEPNAFTTIPAGVRLWIDGRTPDAARLARWRAELEDAAAALAAGSGVQIELATASHTEGVTFDGAVLAAIGDLPQLVCFAGHDAGIIAQSRPAGMVFVRNATGVSHAPEEHVELDDAAVAAAAVLTALEALA